MSLFGMMKTGISGMEGQANKLGTVADNIANTSTHGYKRYEMLFSTAVVNQSSGGYFSGGLNSVSRQLVSQQGVLEFTNSASDLAITGEGFFVVQDGSGVPQLTRAGSFVPNADGELINAAGLKLMGYSFDNGEPSAVANGFDGLEPVNITQSELTASVSENGTLTANLKYDSDVIVPANLPSANAATAEYTHKTSIVTYDTLGEAVLLDVYFTKTDTSPNPETWEVAIFEQEFADPNGFPYSGPAAGALLASETLVFDSTTGRLDAASASDVTFTLPSKAAGGTDRIPNFTLDFEKITQLGADFAVTDIQIDGNAPANVDRIEIADDGTVRGTYADGSTISLYKIPLATVTSPNQMTSKTGNVFLTNQNSGDVQIGFATEGGNGSIASGALEASTVDIAAELTEMIEAQRSYTANSKVFQTASEITDVVINLKR